MKKHVIFIIVTIICAWSWPTSSCYAQGFAKAAKSAFHSIRVNKVLVTTKAARDYTIQERQRRQIAQNVAHQTLQSTSHLNSVAVTNARFAAANKKSALIASPRHDVTKLPKGIQNDSILIPILPDTTSVVNNGNH